MAKTSIYSEKAFSLVRFCRIFGGVWLPKERRISYRCYSTISLVYSTWFIITEIMKLSDMDANDLYIEQVGFILGHVIISVKVIYFHANIDKVTKLMDSLENLEDLFLQYKPTKEFNPSEILKKCRSSSYKSLFSYTCVLIGATICNASPSIIRHLITSSKQFAANGGNTTCADILPHYSWFPFQPDSKENCGWAVLLQCTFLTFIVSQIMGVDILIMAVEYKIESHFILLQNAFRTIRSTCLENLKLPEDYRLLFDEANPVLEKEMYENMKKYTMHLQKVIQFTQDVETVFTWINLGVILSGMSTMAVSFYAITSNSVTPKHGVPLYLAYFIYQLGLYTSCGNIIITSSEEIPRSLYFSDWTSASQRFKKSMLLNMTRLQRPVYLTIGKFSPMTLATFLSIMRAAYSYYALLKDSNRR